MPGLLTARIIVVFAVHKIT